ncbi:MAG: UvrD-helicase domain-containing protein [Flavobacteriales bacterium]|nr:UvrD-helicase domain-containing protein [Flavobacteriales bacterium]
MSDYLQDLNSDQQKAVIQINGAIMVIAGAGSGKTRVLTYKIAHLLKNGVSPFNILSLTFTNKASKEMRGRIDKIVGGELSKSLWMGTFHSVFSRILRSESEKLRYPTNFTIYDTADSKSLIRSIIKDLQLDKEVYKVGTIQNRISSLKNNFITPEGYNNHPELLQTDTKAKRTEFGRIYHLYQQRCFKSGAMDFDDLLLNTYKLLTEFPEALHKYQNTFEYILVDEYQDTNHLQYLIIKKLAARNENICVVGDDAQSIYAFRGANIKNILNFKIDYPDYKLYKLEQNYRSTKNIVKTANSLIKHNEKQIEKDVWTENKEGESIIICETATDNDEGKLVTNTINGLLSDENYNDFAILYRTNAQSRALEESLRKMGMPYKIYGGLSFYQRKEIKDLLSYFRMVINPKDEEALKRTINYPARGIGSTTIQKLLITANDHNISIWEVISEIEKYNIKVNSGTKIKLESYVTLIKSFRSQSEEKDAYDLAEHITKSSGLYSLLKSDTSPEGVSRFENIQELLSGMQDFTKNYDGDSTPVLSEFMKDVALLTDTDNEKKEDFNKVTLMTIHASKGLEFPYVFVVGMEEGLFPSMMSGNSQSDLEEERRLFYVAITRSEKRLFLSHSNIRFKWGQYIDSEASRFLSELDQRYVSKKNFVKSNTTEISPQKIFAKTKNNYKKAYPAKGFKKISNTNHNIQRSDLTKLKNGQLVKHEKFGTGKIINLEGEGGNKKATVFFNGIGQKQLLLKFAKLEILK